MLAQNFKTATDLDITTSEFDALYLTLRALEREEIEFDIRRWSLETDPACKSAACIGGWASRFLGEVLYPHARPQLAELFFMNSVGGWTRQNPTPSQGAMAVRNFLTHGEPRWSEILAS